jgi:maltoporin
LRRATRSFALSALLVTAVLSTDAFGQDPTDDTDADTRRNTTAPNDAQEEPAPVLSPVTAPTPVAVAPAPPPKFGDLSVTGYFRGSFGASNQKGRMTCFQLGNPSGLISKYRLGNECEVWSETHFTMVTYVGDDGSVASVHVMPTVYIPNTYIGYSPNGAVNTPAMMATSTGAVLYFPNLYADIKGIPWLFGGTAWAGTRYYKRESVYISDFFYWNPSGVGAGIEDINLGKNLRLSYAAFAIDGEPGTPPDSSSPPLPNQVDFGVRNDLQLRGIKFWESGEFQLGFQAIANYSNNPATHGGWGATFQFVQQFLGGDNHLAIQYGRGGGTGFGTLARFYYPDFSINHDLSEARFRVVDVATIQPIEMIGAQAVFVYQRDDNFLGNAGLNTTWISTGGRLAVAISKHLKALGEAGYDQITKSNGSPLQFLAKATGALAISADRKLYARPELRLFYTWARWNEAARTVGVDSGRIYTNVYPQFLTGSIFGMQVETWW